MRGGTVLLLLGLIALAIYARLYFRTISSAGPEEAKRYSETVAGPRLNLIGAPLLGAAFLVPVPSLAVGVALLALGWIVFGTFRQRDKMRALGFRSDFTERLQRVSLLSPLAIGCLLASKLWFQFHAA